MKNEKEMEEKVYFKNSKGLRLCGILSDQGSTKERLIIILCHGLGTSKDSHTCVRLQEILNKHQISTFRFDFFGHGESEGKFESINISEAVDDILNAIKFLKDYCYTKIGLIGSSFGAAASLIAASKTDDLFILALKSPLSYPDVYEASKKIKVPILIVHGENDEVVQVEQSRKIANLIKDCKLEVIEGADHRYSNPEDFEKMLDLISKFIIENSIAKDTEGLSTKASCSKVTSILFHLTLLYSTLSNQRRER